MQSDIMKRLLSVPDQAERFGLMKLFEHLHRNQCLSSAALTGGTNVAVAALGADLITIINGALTTKASTSTIAITGPTIANSGSVFQVWLFTLDNAATPALTAYAGTPAATLAAVVLPIISPVTTTGTQQVVIGGMTMNNASVGSFIPATTKLDVANLGIDFFNTIGPFYPTPAF